jgi:hypothetical protein
VKLSRLATISLIVAAAFLSAAPAMADPPTANRNSSILTLDCTRGSETQTFLAVTISQNAALAAQLVDGTGVIIIVHAEFNGEVVFDIPGQAGRSDLWSCTIAEFPPGVVVDAFVAPRA